MKRYWVDPGSWQERVLCAVPMFARRWPIFRAFYWQPAEIAEIDRRTVELEAALRGEKP